MSVPILASRSSQVAGLILLPFLLAGFCSCGHQRRMMVDAAASQANSPRAAAVQLTGTAVRSTAIAVARQPVTSLRLGWRLLAFRTGALVRGNIPFTVVESLETTAPPGSREFSDGLTRLGLPAPVMGTADLLVDGREFFPAFEAEVRAAKDFIDIQIYIWDNDAVATRCADLVRWRSHQIPIRVLVDDIGTSAAHAIAPDTPAHDGFEAPPDMVRYLQEGSRVQARRSLNPLLVLDHTKLLVFDGKAAILGGMNIGQEYLTEWHDLMVRVRGPIVDALRPPLEKQWRLSGPWGDFSLLKGSGMPAGSSRPQVAPPGSYPIRILRTEAVGNRHEILKAVLQAIGASRKRVWVENAYVTNDQIVDALISARARGVDVRVIIPGRKIDTIMDLANLASANALIKAGVKVYRYPGMTHMKTMICDGWATIGAANLDTNSLLISHELNIAFEDPEMVESLARRVFRRDFAKSRRLTLATTDSPLGALIEPIADQL